MKIAVLFSGQGAQVKSMGLDFINQNDEAKALMALINKSLSFNYEETVNDETKLNQTKYTQPLMLAMEIMIHDLLVKKGLKISGYAGFSLGEYAALYAAGIYDLETIMKLITYRANLMDEVSKSTNGKMSAILGLSDLVVEEVCEAISTKHEIVVAANYNAPNQLVISGSETAVLKANELLKERGAKRALLLNVSGAFHSPYMKESGKILKAYAKDFKMTKPKFDLYKNSDTNILKMEDVLTEIENQIYQPVYFKQSIEKMIKDGYTHFIEIGPGSVLSGLVKKINNEVTVISVSNHDDLEKIKEFI